MTKRKSGVRIGTVTLIEVVGDFQQPSGKIRKIWKCQCSCGKIVQIKSTSLHKNSSCKDCQNVKNDFRKKVSCTKLEILHRSRYYHMLARCNDPSKPEYKNYGARGIGVCERWTGEEGLTNFCKDMGNCPKGCTLDRIDNNGNYCPENCKWSDWKTQSFNKRKNTKNTSGRVGVYWFSRVGKWTAAIVVDGVQKHLGYFIDFEKAVEARIAAETLYWGEVCLEANVLKKSDRDA